MAKACGCAKFNGPASEYAKPHTMSGGPYIPKKMRDPNLLKATELGPREAVPRVSAGDPGKNDVKTSGIKMRGYGAATKGTMSRGPMG
jgi:hypothetical protein